MKKSIFAWAAVVALVFASCNEKPYINPPSDNSFNSDTVPVLKADTNGTVVSVDSALVIGNGQPNDTPTAEKYKVSGTISSIITNLDDVPGKYTNVNFDLSDGKVNLRCQYTNYLNNYPFRNNKEVPRVGSKVTVLGPMSKYNGSPQMINGFIVRVDSLVTE